MSRFDIRAEVWAASDKLHENNDCTVKALAIVTGLDYGIVHAAAAKCGRKHRKGMTRATTAKTAKALGFKMEDVKFTAKTAITIERDRKLQSGRYIIGMNRHLAAMVDGKLIDWTIGKRKPINGVYILTPMTPAPIAEAIITPAHDWLAIPVQNALNF